MTNRCDDTLEMHFKDTKGTTRIFRLFGAHVRQYAPKFTSQFQSPYILVTQLRDIPEDTVDLFAGWLRACWFQEKASKEVPLWWALLGPTPKYDVTGDPINWEGSTVLDRVTAAVNLYLFAKAYHIPRLRQDALDRLVSAACVPSDPEVIARAYRHTSRESPLRRALVDCFYKSEMNGPDFAIDTVSTMPEDFVFDVLAVMFGIAQNISEIPSLLYCDYHEHKDQTERSRCRVRVRCESLLQLREVEFGEDADGIFAT